MENFTAYNPTMVHFGKDVCSGIADTLLKYGKNVLLMYGRGSVKKHGTYNEVMAYLTGKELNITEYSGIKSNPEVEDVNKAARLGIESGTEVIVALGGGSVIDSAKLTALCIAGHFDAWDVVCRKVKPVSAIPVITVLTLAATGTEMNPFAVVQNPGTKQKTGYGNPLIFPKHSYLDPRYTVSVPANYTAYGVADLVAHALESYFADGNASLSDRFVEAIIREVIHYAPLLMKNLSNYDYRSRILWASTCALNGTTAAGRPYTGDWGVHDIGHTLSFLYDMPHGASLSIAYPAWLKHHREKLPDRIRELGVHLYGFSSVDRTIANLTDFFRSLDCPVKLGAAGIGSDKKQEIIDLMIKNNVNGQVHRLTADDYVKITELMY